MHLLCVHPRGSREFYLHGCSLTCLSPGSSWRAETRPFHPHLAGLRTCQDLLSEVTITLLTTVEARYDYPHLTGKKPESQRTVGIFPRSRSQSAVTVEARIQPQTSWTDALVPGHSTFFLHPTATPTPPLIKRNARSPSLLKFCLLFFPQLLAFSVVSHIYLHNSLHVGYLSMWVT